MKREHASRKMRIRNEEMVDTSAAGESSVFQEFRRRQRTHVNRRGQRRDGCKYAEMESLNKSFPINLKYATENNFTILIKTTEMQIHPCEMFILIYSRVNINSVTSEKQNKTDSCANHVTVDGLFRVNRSEKKRNVTLTRLVVHVSKPVDKHKKMFKTLSLCTQLV